MNDEELRSLARPERGDAVYVGALSPLTFSALRELSEVAKWSPLSQWMTPADVLLLIERLEQCKDHEDVFPHVKWATIQRLQDIFDKGFWG